MRINFGGLTVNAGDTLVLSMTPMGAVPEPAPAVLLIAGLAALTLTAQTRRRRAGAIRQQTPLAPTASAGVHALNPGGQ